jgi:hypothetical protein
MNGESQSTNRAKSRDRVRGGKLRELPQRQTNVGKKLSIQRQHLKSTFVYAELEAKTYRDWTQEVIELVLSNSASSQRHPDYPAVLHWYDLVRNGDGLRAGLGVLLGSHLDGDDNEGMDWA